MFEFTYSPYAIPNFIVAMYTLLLGSFVLLKPKKKTILHVSFFFMSFTFFIWLGNYMLCYLSTDEIQALFWARNAYIGIVFIGVATHHLFVSLLKRNKKDRFQVRLSYVLGFIFLGLSRTEVFFSRAYKYFWGYYPKGATWLYSVFLVFFFWFFIRTFIVTTKELIRYKKDNLPGYQNLKILFTAVAIALIGAIDYIAKYGIEFYPFGYVFILIWLNMVAYTIIKYKVFDIETIIHKTLLWLVMSTLVIAPLGGIIYFAYPYLQDRGPFLIAVFAIFLFILMLVYYNKIQPVIDQLFQRKKHDYRKILEEFLAKISTLNNITKLMDSTDDVIKKTLYTEKIEYFLVGNEGAVIPYKSKKFTGPLQAGESVLKWLQKEKDVVEIDVIISDPRYVKIKENMMGLFEEIDAEILVPVVHNDKLLGMMGLSKKKNMKNYTDLDIKFLKDLSMELGIALANSLMFETVNRQNVELKELDKLKNEFLANTSHELRTPLNGIIGLAEAMYEGADGKVNDKMTKHLGMITNSAKSLRNLVSDILDLSKMQSGKQEFEISRISIEKVMEDVRPVIEGLVIDKPIKVEFDIKKGLPDVFIDRGKIKQVMINLIGNAVKFTSKGSVRISARSYDKKDGYIQVSVQDTGIGMKKEDLKVIFDEFRQADGSATRSFEGTGLGLAITKKIVTAHTGTIWAESTLGKGSTLHFTLSTKEFKEVSVFKEEKEPEYFPAGPMEKEDITVERRKKERDFDPSIKGFLAEEEYKSEDLKRYPKGKGEKLLIVDDIEVNLESLALSLQGKGYKVSKALSAKDALKLLKSGNYNLIISDVMMPDMDGYQLVEKIKASDKLVKIPVILLTAKTRLEDKRKGFQVGADDYMVKPFEIGELMLRIRKMIDNRLEIGKGFLSTDDKEYSTVQDNRFKRIHKGRDEIILAIDDNPINLEVVKTRLEMNNWKVEVAEGGKDGLLKYKSLRPNLILLDIMMPEVDGYEVCRMIREEYKDKMIPIIFLTAKKEQEDKIYGINVGGDDYVTKPFDKDDLVIRVSQHLKNREMMQEVKEKKLLEYDMELAGEIQKKLIPKVFPKDKAIDFFGGSQAAKGVGGDYFDIIDIGNGKYLCVVVDVMGKGMSAALVMVKIETLLKSFSHKSEIDLKEIIRKINQNIYKDLEGDRYASMFLMVYDSISHKIEYINAGHEPLLIYDHKTGKIKELMSKLYALGINEAYDEIDVSTAVLNPKDVFIMYTDGINEAMNKDRKQFGKERVRKMLSKYNDMNIMTIYKSFMDEVAEYTKGVAQHDDITLVIGKVK